MHGLASIQMPRRQNTKPLFIVLLNIAGSSMSGFVYVLFNESMPGILKIGQTSKNPFERMRQLSSATCCPRPFEMMAYIECEDYQRVEILVHSELASARINPSREFFKAKRMDALEAISWALDHLELEEISGYAPWPLREEEIENGPY